MNQIIKFQFILLLVFNLTFSAFASYNIEVNESFHHGQCHASITVTPKGNAGDFNIRFYQVGYPNVPHREFLNVKSAESIQYTPFYGWAQIVIIIDDRFGCEYSEMITWDCNCEGMSMTFHEQYIKHPLTCDPEDRSGAYRIVGEIVENGVGPYNYEWSDPAIFRSGLWINNFNHGTFTVTATDFRGCTATGEVTMIGQNAPERFHYKYSPTCEGQSNGTLAFFYIGQGDPEDDLQISISPTINTNNFLIYFDEQQVAQVEAEGLAAGIYCVTIEDEGTQCYVEDCYEIKELSIEDPFVYNEQSTIQSIVKTCKGEATGSVNIFAEGGIPFNAVEIVEDGVVLPAAIYAYEYTWNDGTKRFNGLRNGLAEGSYSVTIEDYCGYMIIAEVFIPAYPEIEIEVGMTPGCYSDGGDLEIMSITGGDDGNDFSLSDYDVKWMLEDDLTSNDFKVSGLIEGYHTVQVTNKNTGCYQEINTFLDNYPEIVVDVQVDNACIIPWDIYELLFEGNPFQPQRTKQLGSVTTAISWYDGMYYSQEIHTTGDPNAVKYKWNDTEMGANITITDLDFGTNNYELRIDLVVTDEQYGCKFYADITVRNVIEIVNNNFNTGECTWTIQCPGYSHNESVNVDKLYRECCFYRDCYNYECLCLYPNLGTSNFSHSWPAEFELDIPDIEEQYDPEVEYLGNCKIINHCPDPPDHKYCTGITPNDGDEPVDQDPCEYYVGTCSETNMYIPEAPSDPDHPIPLPIFDSYVYSQSSSSGFDKCIDDGFSEAQNMDNYCLIFQLPTGGGEISISRGSYTIGPNNTAVWNLYDFQDDNIMNPWVYQDYSHNPPRQEIDLNHPLFSEGPVGGFKFDFADQTKWIIVRDCDNLVFADNSSNREFKEEETIRIFPNPTSKGLNVNFDLKIEKYYIKILDLHNHVIAEIVYKRNTSGEIYIPVNDFPAGVYFLEFNDMTLREIKKFVVLDN